MKNNIFICSIIFFLIGGCAGVILVAAIDSAKMEDNQRIIDNSRNAAVALNAKYNDIFQYATQEALIYEFQGEENLNMEQLFRYSSLKTLSNIMLSEFFPLMLDECRSLGLDCSQYDENGNPTIVEKEGKKDTLEILPEIVRVK